MIDELAMVVRAGLDVGSRGTGAILNVVDISEGLLGIGMCSALSLVFLGGVMLIGGGLCFLFMTFRF